jgi:hypothetical protein
MSCDGRCAGSDCLRIKSGFAENGGAVTVSSGVQRAITSCVRSSGIGNGPCAKLTMQGMSCQTALAVIAAYRKAPRGKSKADGMVVKHFAVDGQTARCKELDGVAICQVGTGRLAFPSQH